MNFMRIFKGKLEFVRCCWIIVEKTQWMKGMWGNFFRWQSWLAEHQRIHSGKCHRNVMSVGKVSRRVHTLFNIRKFIWDKSLWVHWVWKSPQLQLRSHWTSVNSYWKKSYECKECGETFRYNSALTVQRLHVRRETV